MIIIMSEKEWLYGKPLKCTISTLLIISDIIKYPDICDMSKDIGQMLML